MYKVHIHKSLLHYNHPASIEIDIRRVSDLFSYLQNLYPYIDKEKVLLLTQEKNKFPDSWLLRDEIPENQSICYIVPLICGNFEITAAAVGQMLLRAAIGTVINFALGAIIQLIMPKPKNNSNQGITDQDRANNDSFEGIINTVDSSNSIALNYGMIRVGGQIISADVDTINHGKGEVIRVDNYV